MMLNRRAPRWRPLVVLGVVAALAGCGGGDDEGDPDRPAGVAGLKAALQETLDAGEQDATMFVRRGTGTSEEGSVETLRLSGRFNPAVEAGEATLTVAVPSGVDLDLPELKLTWDANNVQLNDGPQVPRVKAREGNGGQIAAAVDQIQGLIDVVREPQSVGQPEPNVWTFEVPASAQGAAEGVGDGGGARGVWRGEATAKKDGKGLEQITLRVPTGTEQGDFRLILLSLG